MPDNLDDTQPNAPVQPPQRGQSAPPQRPPNQPPPDGTPYLNPPDAPYGEPPQSSGPGCFVIGLIGLVAVLISLAVVGLAGTAGWTAGERIADRNATATQSVVIGQQIARIPQDVAEGNTVNLNRRLNYLETVAPNLPDVAIIQQTATALYINNLPTATPTPTVTPIPTQTPLPTMTTEATAPPVVEVTEEIVPTVDPALGGLAAQFDLNELLQEASGDAALGEYEAAYENLDIIVRIDSNFQRATVRQLMFDVLTRWARDLYTAESTLAEAIRLTNLAEEFGSLEDNPLSYERFIAELYLGATRAISAGDHLSAINRLREIIAFQGSYLGQNLNRLLFNEYVNYAQAWEFGQEYCQAVVQYNNALNLFADMTVEGRRDTAQQLCAAGLTPTPPGGATPAVP